MTTKNLIIGDVWSKILTVDHVRYLTRVLMLAGQLCLGKFCQHMLLSGANFDMLKPHVKI